MILCDIGNTFFHFCEDNFLWNVLHHEELLMNNLEKIYYISVHRESEKKLLQYCPHAYNLAHVLPYQGNYNGLGVDRQMAIYGIDNGIIIDAGSAITVDCVINGCHQGGAILPGLETLGRSFPLISSRLPFPQWSERVKKYPQNTQEAVLAGSLGMIIAFIRDFSSDQKIIFTGGDGKILHHYFPQSELKEKLLFDNMKRLIKEKDLIC